MKRYITDRQKIAFLMNSGEFPVLSIDFENEMRGYSGCYTGCKVNVVPKSKRLADSKCWTRGTLKFFGDCKKFEIMPETVCLSDSFGYRDVMEMADFANAPLIEEGQKVVLLQVFPNSKYCMVSVMRVGHVADHVYPVCCLEELTDEEFESMSFQWKR